jgi:hypothetical protein
MRIATKSLAGVLLAVLPLAPLAADPLICSLSSIRSCDELTGCEPVLHEEYNIPRFWKVDLEQRTITATRPDGSEATTKIQSLTGRLTRASIQGVENGRAWSATIGDDGSLSLVVSGEGFGFVGFGACTNP